MQTLRMFVIIGAVALAGCQTSGSKDSGGRSMSLSKPTLVAHENADINLARFIDAPGLKIERTIRDNGAVIIESYRIQGRVIARTQRTTDAWFSEQTQSDLKDPGRLARTLKSGAYRFDANAPKPAPQGRHGKIIGHYSTKGACVALGTGHVFRKGATYDNDFGNSDTLVDFAACNVLTESPESVIPKLRRMAPDDRAAIIARKPAA